jgi:flagellar biosynthesis protein FlhF
LNGKIRTFRAANMPAALARVKKELGPDAVILGTRTLRGDGVGRLIGAATVEITAAPGTTPMAGAADRPARPGAAEPAQTPAPNPSPAPPVSPALRAYYIDLLQKEVAAEIAERLIESLRATLEADARPDRATVHLALKRLIAGMLPVAPTDRQQPAPRRIALVGPAGAGKTTTLAKLAAQARLRQRRTVGLVSLDMYRLAATAQLQRYAEILDIPMRAAATESEVREALRDLENCDLVLIDTPGLGTNDERRRDEVAKLLAVAAAEEVHLALPGSRSQAAQCRAAKFFEPLGVTHLLLTKLDDSVGFGVVLNVLEFARGWKLSYVTNGQNVPQDIFSACGEQLAELILS